MSVNSYLDKLSSELVLNGVEKANIKRSINGLEQRLGYYFNNIENKFIFGSYTRGTMLPRKADSNSDVDYMIVFDNSSNFKPDTYLNHLRKFSECYYSRSEIYRSHPTVVLDLNHIKFELVPAFAAGWFSTGYKIPAPSTNYFDWMSTNPNGFNESLTEKNKETNFKLKPAIRLAKYWNARNGNIYSSFSIEEFMTDKNYSYGCSTVKDYFFEFALSLGTNNLPQASQAKVNRLQKIVNECISYDKLLQTYDAELKIQSLLPRP